MNFIMHAESLKKITFSLQICFFHFSLLKLLLVSLKIARLDKGMLGRLFSRPLDINFIQQAFLFDILPILLFLLCH